MKRAQYAEILTARREKLRLSIPQAAKVLRLRESVLIAFENGDFDNLPQLGYAQGMVSSYARYLGLDPAQIAALYEEEHAAYIAEVTGSRPTGLASLRDEPRNQDPASAAREFSSNNSYTSRHSQVQGEARNSSSVRSVSLPSGRNYDSERYSSEIRSDSARQASERRYTTRRPVDGGEQQRRQQAERIKRVRYSDEIYASERSRSAQDTSDRRRSSLRSTYSSHAADDIETRHINAGQYSDDLRYDSEAQPYRPSSSQAGRQALHRTSAPQRPNVARRSSQSSDPRNRNRRQRPQNNGIAGYLQDFFSDSQRAILTICVLLACLLLLILIFSVRSCIDANASDSRQVSVVTTIAATTTEAASTTSAEEQQALSEAAAKKAASAEAAASTETVVKVSVADGVTTWVEITCDGEQAVAESVTGEWSQEFTVTKSITIQVVDPSSVTVEKNGEVQTFSSKTAGLSSMTIEGTDPAAAAAATEDATTEDAEE